MASLYMLDTNIASYAIKGDLPTVRKQLLSMPMSQVCISAVTKAELLYGVTKRPNAKDLKTAVDEFLLRIDSLSWDDESARHYASLRNSLERRGKSLGNMDMMIAAHALSVKAILVTADKAFSSVEQLTLENWTKSR